MPRGNLRVCGVCASERARDAAVRSLAGARRPDALRSHLHLPRCGGGSDPFRVCRGQEVCVSTLSRVPGARGVHGLSPGSFKSLMASCSADEYERAGGVVFEDRQGSTAREMAVGLFH